MEICYASLMSHVCKASTAFIAAWPFQKGLRFEALHRMTALMQAMAPLPLATLYGFNIFVGHSAFRKRLSYNKKKMISAREAPASTKDDISLHIRRTSVHRPRLVVYQYSNPSHLHDEIH